MNRSDKVVLQSWTETVFLHSQLMTYTKWFACTEDDSGLFFFFFFEVTDKSESRRKTHLYIKSRKQKWARGASRSCGKYYVLSHSSITKKGNLSKSGDSVMTAGAVAAMGMNLPRFRNIHRRASWNELTQGQKTFFFCVARHLPVEMY